VNHFLARIGTETLLERHVPTTDSRCAVSHARALGVLLRSIIVEREPIYGQQEMVQGFADSLFGLRADELRRLSDDRIGRALDRLFDADRAALLTDVALAVGQRFGVRFDEFHNDSTSVRFCGQYRAASRRTIRGRTAPAITYGFSKDHRPDLKQLLFILTMDADGNVPVNFRCADGNTSDSTTHIESWKALRALAGRTDFLYVADSKLCSYETMDFINRAGGRFVTVLPRSRFEDGHFRKWIQKNTPTWELVWDRENPRHADGPRDRWSVYRAEIPSGEGWMIVWVHSTLLALRQKSRRDRIVAAAIEALADLRTRLAGTRARLRGAVQIDEAVAHILEKSQTTRYLRVRRVVREEHQFKQAKSGRPGANTVYQRVTRRRFDIEWTIDDDAVTYDQKSDGMYPLITNDRKLSPPAVLEAHKGQPMIEKRFAQMKDVHEIAPVFLKNEGRIEALFTLHFLALLVQALIERELRTAMQREAIAKLPLYPEQRACERPTTEQVLRLYSHIMRHRLRQGERIVQTFPTELTELQCRILRLLGVPQQAYQAPEAPEN
jgi:transposase